MSVNSIHSIALALQSVRAMDEQNRRLEDAGKRVSSGRRVVDARENSASFVLAQQVRGQSAAFNVVRREADVTRGLLKTAIGGAESIGDLLTEMRAKALAAQDPMITSAQRKLMTLDLFNLGRQVDQIAYDSEFLGRNLLVPQAAPIDSTTFTLDSAVTVNNPGRLTAVDYDSDGRTDVLATTDSNDALLLRNSGNFGVSQTNQLVFSGGYYENDVITVTVDGVDHVTTLSASTTSVSGAMSQIRTTLLGAAGVASVIQSTSGTGDAETGTLEIIFDDDVSHTISIALDDYEKYPHDPNYSPLTNSHTNHTGYYTTADITLSGGYHATDQISVTIDGVTTTVTVDSTTSGNSNLSALLSDIGGQVVAANAGVTGFTSTTSGSGDNTTGSLTFTFDDPDAHAVSSVVSEANDYDHDNSIAPISSSVPTLTTGSFSTADITLSGGYHATDQISVTIDGVTTTVTVDSTTSGNSNLSALLSDIGGQVVAASADVTGFTSNTSGSGDNTTGSLTFTFDDASAHTAVVSVSEANNYNHDNSIAPISSSVPTLTTGSFSTADITLSGGYHATDQISVTIDGVTTTVTVDSTTSGNSNLSALLSDIGGQVVAANAGVTGFTSTTSGSGDNTTGSLTFTFDDASAHTAVVSVSEANNYNHDNSIAPISSSVPTLTTGSFSTADITLSGGYHATDQISVTIDGVTTTVTVDSTTSGNSNLSALLSDIGGQVVAASADVTGFTSTTSGSGDNTTGSLTFTFDDASAHTAVVSVSETNDYDHDTSIAPISASADSGGLELTGAFYPHDEITITIDGVATTVTLDANVDGGDQMDEVLDQVTSAISANYSGVSVSNPNSSGSGATLTGTLDLSFDDGASHTVSISTFDANNSTIGASAATTTGPAGSADLELTGAFYPHDEITITIDGVATTVTLDANVDGGDQMDEVLDQVTSAISANYSGVSVSNPNSSGSGATLTGTLDLSFDDGASHTVSISTFDANNSTIGASAATTTGPAGSADLELTGAFYPHDEITITIDGVATTVTLDANVDGGDQMDEVLDQVTSAISANYSGVSVSNPNSSGSGATLTGTLDLSFDDGASHTVSISTFDANNSTIGASAATTTGPAGSADLELTGAFYPHDEITITIDGVATTVTLDANVDGGDQMDEVLDQVTSAISANYSGVSVSNPNSSGSGATLTGTLDLSFDDGASHTVSISTFDANNSTIGASAATTTGAYTEVNLSFGGDWHSNDTISAYIDGWQSYTLDHSAESSGDTLDYALEKLSSVIQSNSANVTSIIKSFTGSDTNREGHLQIIFNNVDPVLASTDTSDANARPLSATTTTGGGLYDQRVIAETSGAASKFLAADFDQDGDDDLVVTKTDSAVGVPLAGSKSEYLENSTPGTAYTLRLGGSFYSGDALTVTVDGTATTITLDSDLDTGDRLPKAIDQIAEGLKTAFPNLIASIAYTFSGNGASRTGTLELFFTDDASHDITATFTDSGNGAETTAFSATILGSGLASHGGGDITGMPAESLVNDATYGLDGQNEHAVLGDVNNDGLDDVIKANASGQLTAMLSNGDGSFTAGATSTTPGGLSGHNGFAVGDIDMDGNLDVAVNDRENNRVRLGFGDGAGNFNFTHEVATNSAPQHSHLADLNGDLIPDLLVAQANQVQTFLGDLYGNFSQESDFTTGGTITQNSQIQVVDLNNDGEKDFIASMPGDGRVEVHQRFEDGSYTLATAQTGLTQPGGVVATDLNGDQAPDLVIADHAGGATGEVQIHLNSDPTVVSQMDDVEVLVSDTGENMTISHAPMALYNLGIDPDILATDPETGLTQIDAALENHAFKLGRLTNQYQRFSQFTNYANAIADAATEALGDIVDANIPTESAKYRAAQLRHDLSVQSLPIVNQATNWMLGLFRS